MGPPPYWASRQAKRNTPRFDRLTPTMFIDTESVQGPHGRRILARLTLINSKEELVYDPYVYEPGTGITSTNYRHSGIRDWHILPDNGALEFRIVKRDFSALVAGCVLGGHSLSNEFKALGMDNAQVRTLGLRGILDTQRYSVYREYFPQCSPGPGLKNLVERVFEEEIQEGRHCSRQDAVAALRLYLLEREGMDAEQADLLARRYPVRAPVPVPVVAASVSGEGVDGWPSAPDEAAWTGPAWIDGRVQQQAVEEIAAVLKTTHISQVDDVAVERSDSVTSMDGSTVSKPLQVMDAVARVSYSRALQTPATPACAQGVSARKDAVVW